MEKKMNINSNPPHSTITRALLQLARPLWLPIIRIPHDLHSHSHSHSQFVYLLGANDGRVLKRARVFFARFVRDCCCFGCSCCCCCLWQIWWAHFGEFMCLHYAQLFWPFDGRIPPPPCSHTRAKCSHDECARFLTKSIFKLPFG